LSGLPGQVDFLAGQVAFKAYLPKGAKVQASHALTKSLATVRQAIGGPRRANWDSCLLKGQAGIQFFFSSSASTAFPWRFGMVFSMEF